MVQPEYRVKRSDRHIHHVSKSLEARLSTGGAGATDVVLK